MQVVKVNYFQDINSWHSGKVIISEDFWVYYFLICFIFQVKSPQKDTGIKEHLSHACEVMKEENITQFQDIESLHRAKWAISKKFKLIACMNMKAGSTNILRVLYTLDHLAKYTDTNKIGKGRARHDKHVVPRYETKESFEKQFKSYKKFMFVRDPIERLLSAYRAGLPHGMFKWNNMTFKAFLENVAIKSDRNINGHVVSFSRKCSPCSIKYDFIGLTDSYGEDMRTILKSVGAATYVTLPQRNQTGYRKRKSSEALQTYLKENPKSLLRKIYEKFYWDYFLFGFTKPDF